MVRYVPLILILLVCASASADEFRVYLGRDELGSEFFAEAGAVRKLELDAVAFRLKKVQSEQAIQRSVEIQPTKAAKLIAAGIGVELAKNRMPHAWMSVSPGDNDDTVFVSTPCRLFRNK